MLLQKHTDRSKLLHNFETTWHPCRTSDKNRETYLVKKINEYNSSVFTALTERSGDLALMFEHPLRINPICKRYVQKK
jgi:hypothetical protein